MLRSRMGAVLAGALMLVASTTATAAAAGQSTVPPAARFALSSNALNAGSVCQSGEGYGVDADGNLRRYAYQAQEGPACGLLNFTMNKVIDNGWSGIRQVFADQSTIFAIDSAGDMKWYSYDSTNQTLLPGSGRVIGSGWDIFTHVAYAGDGIFYAVDAAGTLFWYRYLNVTEGTNSWYNEGNGAAIGSGFQIANLFFAARGAIYLSNSAGALFWYGYADPSGPDGVWLPNSGAQVGSGWDIFTSATAEWGAAVRGSSFADIAAVTGDTLVVYRHTGPNSGAPTWSSDSGSAVIVPLG